MNLSMKGQEAKYHGQGILHLNNICVSPKNNGKSWILWQFSLFLSLFFVTKIEKIKQNQKCYFIIKNDIVDLKEKSKKKRLGVK